MATRVIGAAVRGTVRLGLVTFLGAVALAVPTKLSDRERTIRPAEQEMGACLAAGCPDALRERQVARLEDHLFARMPGLDPALHEDLARTILAEAEAARLDPLLVLAVIEVESGYDPSAVSTAGALGLMQLLPGTLQREAEGYGMGASDPYDPVANVRAGCPLPAPLPRQLSRSRAGAHGLQRRAQPALRLDPGRPVPTEVRGYARRVLAEHRRLRRTIPEETGPRFAERRAPLGG